MVNCSFFLKRLLVILFSHNMLVFSLCLKKIGVFNPIIKILESHLFFQGYFETDFYYSIDAGYSKGAL